MRNDGGPAFPRGPIGEDCGQPYGQQAGMTLRDWFAGQALNGIMLAAVESAKMGDHTNEHFIARSAYEVADAMLKARE